MKEIILPPESKRNHNEAPRVEAPGERPYIEFVPRPRRRPWKAYIWPAAGLALVFGLSLAVASTFIETKSGPSAEQVAAEKAARTAALALRDARAQRHEIAALRGHVERLKSRLEAETHKTHAAEATIAALRKNLAERKTQSAAVASQLQAKIDRIELQQARQTIDRTPVGSIGKPLPKPAAWATQKRYRDYVLRDVQHGVALVESAQGSAEVVPGDVLPGGARVEEIEKKHGLGWMVVTDRGYIISAGRWDD